MIKDTLILSERDIWLDPDGRTQFRIPEGCTLNKYTAKLIVLVKRKEMLIFKNNTDYTVTEIRKMLFKKEDKETNKILLLI